MQVGAQADELSRAHALLDHLDPHRIAESQGVSAVCAETTASVHRVTSNGTHEYVVATGRGWIPGTYASADEALSAADRYMAGDEL